MYMPPYVPGCYLPSMPPYVHNRVTYQHASLCAPRGIPGYVSLCAPVVYPGMSLFASRDSKNKEGLCLF